MGKKTLLLFLGLLAVLALIYFGSGKFSSDKISLNNNLRSQKDVAIADGRVLGAETVKGVLGGVDSLIAKAEQTVRNGAANLVTSVSQSAANQLTQAILGSSTPAISNTQISEQTSSTIASICPSYPKNQTVSYILKFTSVNSGPYSLNWGDGHFSDGVINAQEISISHIYAGSGNYTLLLKVGSSETKKDICIK